MGQYHLKMMSLGQVVILRVPNYLQAVITVAKGFYITPEIGIFDYEHDGAGNDEGDVTYYGIQWKISF